MNKNARQLFLDLQTLHYTFISQYICWHHQVHPDENRIQMRNILQPMNDLCSLYGKIPRPVQKYVIWLTQEMIDMCEEVDQVKK